MKDIERVSKHFEGVKALEKRGFTKEQKEELVICEKVLNWLQDGKDVRWATTLGWGPAAQILAYCAGQLCSIGWRAHG